MRSDLMVLTALVFFACTDRREGPDSSKGGSEPGPTDTGGDGELAVEVGELGR